MTPRPRNLRSFCMTCMSGNAVDRRATISRSLGRSWFGLTACWTVSLAIIFAAGCTSTSRTSSADASSRGEKSGDVAAGAVAERNLIAQLDQQYVIGPTVANELNYRIAWQSSEGGLNPKVFTIDGDSIFVLDDRNVLTRLRIEDGQRVWRANVAAPIEEIMGVNMVGERVYVTAGGAMMVLDANNGAMVAKHDFTKIANTPAVRSDTFLIYGSRDGQVVWHAYDVGHLWRSYKVAHSMHVPPVHVNGILAVVGNDGTLMVLNAADATRLWSRKLLDPVVAKPTIGDGIVYVAGQDYHIWAYDLATGRNIWRVMTDSPLDSSPVLVGDRVYQYVPGTGLMCLDAYAFDAPGGRVLWTSPDVTGSVVMERRGNLVTWDAKRKAISIIEPTRGSIVTDVTVPQVHQLLTGGEGGNEFFAISKDGRVIRLSPRT